jgi:hypothetical protein
MPDPADRFLAAATAPLGDNAELQVMARRELEGAISTAGPGSGDSLSDAAEQLESASRRPHAKWWSLTLYAVTGILSVGILASSAKSLLQLRQTSGIIGIFGTMASPTAPEDLDAMLGRKLTSEQKLLGRRTGGGGRDARALEGVSRGGHRPGTRRGSGMGEGSGRSFRGLSIGRGSWGSGS